jgi:hypothetical protein
VAFLYRYNTMGGSLGGFDGDHFIYYLGARHVAIGERPLRDFADAGLQGAWPALTYELPALAYRLAGPSLLTEAVFTLGVIAFSLALLFHVAARIAGLLPAFVVTALALFASTRPYGYPKVLVFSVAVALLWHCARGPTRARIVLLALWSAVAFLFRHDYLVYLAPAVIVLLAAVPPHSVKAAVSRLSLYSVLTAVLLIAPLYSVERYVGLERYARSNLELTGSEARRTELRWPTFERVEGGVFAFLADERNGTAMFYYICLAIPALALRAMAASPALPGMDVGQSRAFLLALLLLTALLVHFFLRGNLGARFGDLGAPIAVLAAWLATVPATMPGTARVLLRGTTFLVAVVATISIAGAENVWQELDTNGFRASGGKIVERFLAVTRELRNLPPWPGGSTASPDPNVVEYLRACTDPGERVLVLADSAEVAAFAERPFAAGQPTFRPGFYTLPGDQNLMLRRLRTQSVPVVLTGEEADYEQNFATGFQQIDAFVRYEYTLQGTLPALTGGPMRVFVRRNLAWDREYRDTGLPCAR